MTKTRLQADELYRLPEHVNENETLLQNI